MSSILSAVGAVLVLVGCGRLGFDAATVSDARGGDVRPDGVPLPPGWSELAPLPSARQLHCAVAWGRNMYVIGGSDVARLAEVVVTPVLDDGSVGGWSQATPLPRPQRWHACAIDPATANLYVVGGEDDASILATVLRAPLGPDGTIGSWVLEASLPAPRRGLGLVVEGGVLYAIGGEEADGFQLRNTIYAATLDATGGLAPWATLTPLPLPDYMFGTATAGGRMYLSGGHNTNATVRFAGISELASSAPFTSATALPGPRERHATVVVAGFLYVVGGRPAYADPSLSTAYRAALEADGALGAWTPLSDAPVALAHSAAVAIDGRVYLLGGGSAMNSTARTFVYVP